MKKKLLLLTIICLFNINAFATVFIPSGNNALVECNCTDTTGEINLSTTVYWNEPSVLGEVVFNEKKKDFYIVIITNYKTINEKSEFFATEKTANGFKIIDLNNSLFSHHGYFLQYTVKNISMN